MNSLQQIAHALGGKRGPGGAPWSHKELLDLAVLRYWQERPNIRPACGSEPGYRAHLLAGERTCPPCRDAHATIRAIWRLRRARGVTLPRPALRGCGTHAAFNRHKASGEPIDLACRRGENAYQAERYAARKEAS